MCFDAVSLRNSKAERGGQKACVWQTWQGYYLHVLVFYEKVCLKEGKVWVQFFSN